MQDRLENLKNARCYEDRDGYGYRTSRWINLSKFDIEWSVFEIERLREDNAYFKALIQKSQLEVLDAAFSRAALKGDD